MKLYVLIANQYSNLEYYDVCSTVSGVFSSKDTFNKTGYRHH